MGGDIRATTAATAAALCWRLADWRHCLPTLPSLPPGTAVTRAHVSLAGLPSWPPSPALLQRLLREHSYATASWRDLAAAVLSELGTAQPNGLNTPSTALAAQAAAWLGVGPTLEEQAAVCTNGTTSREDLGFRV